MPANPNDTVINTGNGAISGAASGSGPEDSRRSRKPANTKFKQQQLPAWQPMLTARSVLPFLIAIGVAFIPIGVALFLTASYVTEIEVEYTDCLKVDDAAGRRCSNVSHAEATLQTCKCRESFQVNQFIQGPIFMYYGLDNFFQNHRKYVKSRDDQQLMGEFKAPDMEKKDVPSIDCFPFQMANQTFAYAPCGAIANSLFNDSISISFMGSAQNPNVAPDGQPIDLLRTGIAGASDKNTKFKNPENKDLKAECAAKNLRKPAYWTKELWELDPLDDTNNGLKNEDLIVWMRTAAFPSFRKLYRRFNQNGTDSFKDGLPAGNYTLNIDYNFPVKEFEGRKYVIISSISWIGGRNPFLGIAYMTVGCACLLLAAIFFFIHVRWGRKPSEMMNVAATSHW